MITLIICGLLFVKESTAYATDPMASIRPMRRGYSAPEPSSEQRMNRQNPHGVLPGTNPKSNTDPRQGSISTPEPSLPDKREADGSPIVDTDLLQSELHIQETGGEGRTRIASNINICYNK